MHVLDLLEERGFVEATTSDELRRVLESPISLYCGMDPTADSLHLGHLIPLLGLAWFQKCGHKPVALIGGATALVGDPSGRDKERPLLSEADVERHIVGIQKNLEQVLDFSESDCKPEVLNNYTWFQKFSYIGFLRDVGKWFRMGPMMSKESVKKRLDSDEGMSFTEFTYQTLQGYDFYYLNQNHKVTLQIGGSDQWGNITAGTELTRKLSGEEVYGLTFPLLTRSDGKKFGKSAGGAIWLSPEKCSPYEFFQYLYRTPDSDVPRFMRLLTFMPMDEIRRYEAILADPAQAPNQAQQRLAEEVTRIVHGEEGLQAALKVTAAAKPGAEAALDVESLEALGADMPSTEIAKSDVEGIHFIDLLVKIGLQGSKGEARRLVRQGGAYLNNERVSDEKLLVQSSSFVGGKLMIISAGKKKKMLVRLV